MALSESGAWTDRAKQLPADDHDEVEIDLVELMYRLLEKAKFIVLAALIGAILSGAYTLWFVTPLYSATAKLYVVNSNANSVIDLSALQIGTQLASDYKEVFSNWHVHERVLEKLGLSYTYTELNKMVSVTNSESQRILNIKVTSDSPDEARLMADTYAAVAQEFIADRMSMQRPNIFQEALRPTMPSSPNKTLNVVLGFLAGGLIASIIVMVQFIADDRIRSEEDITKYLGLPVLGIMPDQRQDRSEKKRRRRGSADRDKDEEGAAV